MMGKVSPPRVVALLLTGCWVIGMLWASDAQMRESDQASLLMGAVELARGEASWFGNESYNYDKQYLSYWFVAGVLNLAGGAGSGATIEGVVRVSNLAAVLLFCAALLAVVSIQREWSWARIGLLLCFLLSPVVAFTGLLLSPNLISGAFMLLLVAVLGHGGRDSPSSDGDPSPTKFGLVPVLVLSFASVAARQDAVLLMPLLAAMIVPWHSWKAVLTHPVPWCLMAGCVGALAVGRWIDPSSTPLPSVFFSAPTFAVYMAGGLGGGLLALVVFSGHLLRMRISGGWILACAVLAPLVFYCFLLYTPRHLFASALALAVTFLLPRGVGVWGRVVATRPGRILVAGAVLITVVPWLVGVRMSDWTRGRVVMTNSTSYPTTDGFWPMGAYGSFFSRLARSCEHPIDHNQEVWEAWAALDEELLPSGTGAVISSGLISYGQFSLDWYGREVIGNPAKADYIVFDDRTVAKRQLGVDLHDWHADDKVGKLLVNGRVRAVGRGFGRSVLLWTPEEKEVEADEELSLRAGLPELYGGNDFRTGRWDEAAWKRDRWDGHQIVLAARSREVLLNLVDLLGGLPKSVECRSDYDARPWHATELTAEQLGILLAEDITGGGDLWVACGMLPEFMDVRRYGK